MIYSCSVYNAHRWQAGPSRLTSRRTLRMPGRANPSRSPGRFLCCCVRRCIWPVPFNPSWTVCPSLIKSYQLQSWPHKKPQRSIKHSTPTSRKSALVCAIKQSLIAHALRKDPSAVSRWLSGDSPEKLNVEDIAAFLAACGLTVMPANGATVLGPDEYKALLLFAERGFEATKLKAAA
jgi:hypothetical protein